MIADREDVHITKIDELADIPLLVIPSGSLWLRRSPMVSDDLS